MRILSDKDPRFCIHGSHNKEICAGCEAVKYVPTSIKHLEFEVLNDGDGETSIESVFLIHDTLSILTLWGPSDVRPDEAHVALFSYTLDRQFQAQIEAHNSVAITWQMRHGDTNEVMSTELFHAMIEAGTLKEQEWAEHFFIEPR